MPLFGGDKEEKPKKEKKTKEQKQDEKIQKFISKYGLDELDKNDLKTVTNIAYDLMGSGLIKTGMALSFSKAEEQVKVSYLSALVQQNWLIMNQLSRLTNEIRKTNEK